MANTNVDYLKLAEGFGYSRYHLVKNVTELNKIFNSVNDCDDSIFIEVMCNTNANNNLSRPKEKPIYYKDIFMSALSDDK